MQGPAVETAAHPVQPLELLQLAGGEVLDLGVEGVRELVCLLVDHGPLRVRVPARPGHREACPLLARALFEFFLLGSPRCESGKLTPRRFSRRRGQHCWRPSEPLQCRERRLAHRPLLLCVMLKLPLELGLCLHALEEHPPKLLVGDLHVVLRDVRRILWNSPLGRRNSAVGLHRGLRPCARCGPHGRHTLRDDRVAVHFRDRNSVLVTPPSGAGGKSRGSTAGTPSTPDWDLFGIPFEMLGLRAAVELPFVTTSGEVSRGEKMTLRGTFLDISGCV